MMNYNVPTLPHQGLATFITQAPELDTVARLKYFYDLFPYAEQLPGSLAILDKNSKILACNKYAWEQVKLDGIQSFLDHTSLEIEQRLGWSEKILGKAMEDDRKVLEIGQSIHQETIFNGEDEIILGCKKEAIYTDNNNPIGIFCFSLPVQVKNQRIDSNKNHIHIHLSPKKIIRLTGREFCVLQEMLRGKSALDISKQLQISIKTVETYLMRVKYKLGCEKQREIFPMLVSFNIVNAILDQATHHF